MAWNSPIGLPGEVDDFPGIDRCGKGCRISPSVTVYRTINRHAAAGIFLGDEVLLLEQIRLLMGEDDTQLNIGNRVVINVGCYLSGEGGLMIDDDVIIGPHARLLSAGHGIHGGHPEVWKNPIFGKEIRVGAGAWIGASATILPGIKVGQGAVIGAASVVTHDVPAFAVVVGNPARLLHYRDEFAPQTSLWRRFLAKISLR